MNMYFSNRKKYFSQNLWCERYMKQSSFSTTKNETYKILRSSNYIMNKNIKTALQIKMQF